MCGLFFSLGLAVDKSRIDMIAHRGPDGEGWQNWSTEQGPLFLGHRRLSVIDVSEAAAQPFAYRDGRYHLVFNGEIYNYVELREELGAKGHTFRTQSDSEVLVAAYAEWGEECLHHLLGMFAFIVWDEREKTIFAARDRFGIKPLYYVASNSGVAMASEIKQLLDLPGAERRMNRDRVIDFLSEGLLNHTEETLFVGVQQIRRGEAVLLDLKKWRPGDPLPIRRWYQLPPVGSLTLTTEDAADRFFQLMSDSVKLHLRSDVPVGSCLSGGLDSSAIVCLMNIALHDEGAEDKLNTISACFDEAYVDERPYIDAVNEQTAATSHLVFPDAQSVFDDAEKITWHQDEPYGSSSIYAQWSVFQEAKRQGIKVMLDGQGADEQMAGYHGAFGQRTADLLRQHRYGELLRMFRERKKMHGLSMREQVIATFLPVVPRSVRALALSMRRQVAQHGWLDSPVFKSLGRQTSAFGAGLESNQLADVNTVGNLSVALTDSMNLQMLLHWEDRNSMAHSIESRVPFLDHRLVELNIALGSEHKIVGAETKSILRRAMKDTMPAKITNRQDKLGFATPEEVWFKSVLRKQVEEGVEDTLRLYPDVLNADGTRKLVKGMLNGDAGFNFIPWRIVSLGIWGRRFGVSL